MLEHILKISIFKFNFYEMSSSKEQEVLKNLNVLLKAIKFEMLVILKGQN